jgi:Na+-transporting NADH:ubiquinone oxidoreductase subunit C
MAEEHPLKPFYSVLVLAFACSTLVAAAAVGLKPYQQANKSLDQKKNILAAAGLYDANSSIEEQFSSIETRVIELDTGRFVNKDSIDPATFNQREAAKEEQTSTKLGAEEDIAGIGRQEKYSLVYLVKDGGKLNEVVLPVRGKGLWSTMYGYVAVDRDLNTIRGVSFYEHGETAGLGGEIENPRWQQGWEDKMIYGQDNDVALDFVKNSAPAGSDKRTYQIDALSGATLTTQGVEDMMHFWFGDHGFKPFFDQLRSGGLNG